MSALWRTDRQRSSFALLGAPVGAGMGKNERMNAFFRLGVKVWRALLSLLCRPDHCPWYHPRKAVPKTAVPKTVVHNTVVNRTIIEFGGMEGFLFAALFAAYLGTALLVSNLAHWYMICQFKMACVQHADGQFRWKRSLLQLCDTRICHFLNWLPEWTASCQAPSTWNIKVRLQHLRKLSFMHIYVNDGTSQLVRK